MPAFSTCLMTLLFVIVAGSGAAVAAVPDAQAYSYWISRQDNFTVGLRHDSDAFGVASFAGTTSTMGANAQGTPYLEIKGSTVDTKIVSQAVDDSMIYYWQINGAGNSPVLVHVQTTAFINVVSGLQHNIPGVYNLYPRDMGVAAIASFMTYTETGADQRNYGLQYGGYGLGGTTIQPINDYTITNGGTISYQGTLVSNFDLWVTPNRVNYVGLTASLAGPTSSNFTSTYGREYYDGSVYIDPIFTIDPLFSARYTFEMSAVPAVPEPAGAALLISGLAALCFELRRRRG